MEKQVIRPPGVKPSGAPTSPGIKVGDLIFLSGAVGVHPDGNLAGSDIRSQTKAALEIIRLRLAAADSSLDKVVSALVFLTDMADFPAMNEVYREYFTREPLPARSTVGVSALAFPELRIEIEVVATV